MELAPAILPPRLDLVDARLREGGTDALGRLAVGGELDRVCVFCVLEALRCELEEARPQCLGRLARRRDRGADQRNALRSLSKKPSSGL
jgi:hypothetical protein